MSQRRGAGRDPLQQNARDVIAIRAGPPAGQELVQDRSDRPDIGGRRYWPECVVDLFGGHEGGRAGEPSERSGLGGCRAERLRQSEVGELHHAFAAEEEVLRFDVAVDDSPLVGVLEARECIRGDGARTARSDRAALQLVLERPLGRQLEYQRADPFVDVIVDADDVGVIEGREEASFGRESLPGDLVGHQVRPQLLDCDVASELAMAGRVDHSERTAPDHLPDGICRQRCRERRLEMQREDGTVRGFSAAEAAEMTTGRQVARIGERVARVEELGHVSDCHAGP